MRNKYTVKQMTRSRIDASNKAQKYIFIYQY